MSATSAMQEYRKTGLAPYQVQLVMDVLASPLPARHLLVAPPGLGKTTAAMSLVDEIARANSNYRILVIGPGALTGMYEHHLARALPNATVTIVTRRIFRELEELAEPGQPIWPAPLIAVIGMDTARQDDVRTQLRTVTWDLVICEESHRFARSRWKLLKTIVSDDAFARVLLITATPDVKGIAPLLKKVVRTDWLAPELKDWDDQPLFPVRSPDFKTVVYQRSPDEVSLLENVLSLTKELVSTAVGELVKRTLLRQATSSPIALERTLRNLRNTLAHGLVERFLLEIEASPEPLNDGLDTDADMDASSNSGRSPWQSKSKALVALGEVLDQLESVDRDTKREALESLLQQLEQVPESIPIHICVLCSARATAGYLQSTVSALGTKAWLLTGDKLPKQLNQELDGFKKEGGVLISTVAMLQGLDLRYVQAMVHYDPPSSRAEMHVRVARNSSATNYIIADKSGVLPDEWAFAGASSLA